MITTTSLTHPTMMKKIIKAQQVAMKTGINQYVTNRKGRAVMRVGYVPGTRKMAIYAGNKNLTALVATAFYRFKAKTKPVAFNSVSSLIKAANAIKAAAYYKDRPIIAAWYEQQGKRALLANSFQNNF